MAKSKFQRDTDPPHPLHSREARSRSTMSSSCKRNSQQFQKWRRAPSLNSDLSDISEESDTDNNPAVVGAGARRHRWESWEAWRELKDSSREEVTDTASRPSHSPPPGFEHKVMRAPPGLPMPKPRGVLDDLLADSEPDGPVAVRPRRATMNGPPTDLLSFGGGLFEASQAASPFAPLPDQRSDSPASSRSSPATPVQYPVPTPEPTHAAMSLFGGRDFLDLSFPAPTAKKHSRMFSDSFVGGQPQIIPTGTSHGIEWFGHYTHSGI